ncbi:unnamed protein product [Prunus brigantina]
MCNVYSLYHNENILLRGPFTSNSLAPSVGIDTKGFCRSPLLQCPSAPLQSASPSELTASAFSLRPSAFGLRHPSVIRRVRCLHIPPMIRNRPSAFSLQPSVPFHHSARAMSSHPTNDSESAFSLRPSTFGLRHPSVIRRVRCLHIPPMIRNRPSAFGHQPSAFGLRHPSVIRRVRCLHIPPMIRNRPSAFGH